MPRHRRTTTDINRTDAKKPPLPENLQVMWTKRITDSNDNEVRKAIRQAETSRDQNSVSALLKFLSLPLSDRMWLEEKQIARNTIEAIGITEEHFDQLKVMLKEDKGKKEALEIIERMKSTTRLKLFASLLEDKLSSESKGNTDRGQIVVRRLVDRILTIVLDNTTDKEILDLACKIVAGERRNEYIDRYYLEYVEVLIHIGDARIVGQLKEALRHRESTKDDDPSIPNPERIIADKLKELGVEQTEIDRIKSERKLEVAKEQIKTVYHNRVYRLISNRNDLKRLVFEGAEILEILPDKQAWITINPPELAKQAIEIVKRTLRGGLGALDNLLKQAIGVRTNLLEEAHFTYYADEILDAVIQISQKQELQNNEELAGVIAKMEYTHDIKLRYVTRTISDLSLGDRTGDCTARGNEHFTVSLTWYVNPAYQVIEMSRRNRFIGKMNLALADIMGSRAIVTDAIESNPQGFKGKPYHQDALDCLETAIEFHRKLAKRQKRNPYAYVNSSNLRQALEILRESGKTPKWNTGEIHIQFLMAGMDVGRVLKREGYNGAVGFFYQSIDEEITVIPEKQEKEILRRRKEILRERYLLNSTRIQKRKEQPYLSKNQSVDPSKLVKL